jgi:nucleotide sugar dehydrogenase
MRVLIIGHGFVGKAVHYGFSNNPVDVIDPKYKDGLTYDDVDVSTYDVIFVCVPTPMSEDGSCDVSILDGVLANIPFQPNNADQVVAVKSTIPPRAIAKYSKRKNIVYNPEFLTERSAAEQFVDPQFHVFGGNPETCKRLAKLYDLFSLCNPCPVHIMGLEEASFTKYAINSFLAVKVTFFNQLYDVTQGYAFESIIKAVGSDKRIGHSHTKVPGFDMKKGYGGACFPKDTAAITNDHPELTLIKECVKINNEYRNEYSLDEREKEQHVNYGQTKEELQDKIIGGPISV